MRGIHHSAICVRDVEASLRFWSDGLGLQVLMDERFDGDWPTLLRAPSSRLRAVFLGDPAHAEGGIVELVDLGEVAPGPPTDDPTAGGFLLLSVMVDVAAALERLGELGLGGAPAAPRWRAWRWPWSPIPTASWWSWWTLGRPRTSSG